MASIYKNNNIWYISVSVNGKRATRSLKTENIIVANKLKVQAEYDNSLENNYEYQQAINNSSYKTHKLAFDNLTTAKKKNTSGFLAKGFVTEDEKISIDEEVQSELLNTLTNKQLERLAYNDDLVALSGGKDSKAVTENYFEKAFLCG